MYNLIVILIVAASVLMCLIVLIQESKGGGLASGFADNNSMLGVRKTTDVIEKTTWGLAAVMVILSILSVAFLGNVQTSDSSIMQQAVEQQATNPNNLPAIPQGETPAESAPAEAPAAPAQ
ncbi:MAG: preprotein translocase subunit SecG [Bacteroidaceae bacterium]|nr:preprotein translocase subunit SecG [Bacteroidaceae bacterium]